MNFGHYSPKSKKENDGKRRSRETINETEIYEN